MTQSNPIPEYFKIALVEAVKQTRELYSQDALKSFQGDEIQPGPEYRTDKQLESWLVNHGLETCYHPVSTCKIGQDDLSPVDTNFRLKGIDNLRIADASGGFSNVTRTLIGRQSETRFDWLNHVRIILKTHSSNARSHSRKYECPNNYARRNVR